MEIEQLHSKFEVLKNEYQICKRKLDSKCEALLILSKEMDQCRSERDQFKLMAEQLRERYQGLKRQLVGKDMRPSKHGNNWEYSSHQGQNLGKLLYDAREQTKSLEFEVEDLKQKLTDAQGDIKLLREQIARQRVGTTDEGINTRHFPAYEREDLVKQLESAKEQYLQLERDLQQVLDEKEEQVTERDVYKTKYERLNQELNYVLKGDEKRIVDIDALVMENKYLQDRLKQMEEEKSLAMATASKYKSILEKKKNKGGLKLGQNRNDSLVISQRQVQQLLEEKSCIAPSPQAIADLRGLASALLETVNDKNLALSHQRKTNKILGNRVAELEKKLKTLEVSGLWNVSTGNPGEKINAECQIIKTMIPQLSPSIELSEKTEDDLASEISVSAPPSSTELSPIHEASRESTSGRRLSMEDLDLLPTKEVSQKSIPSSEVSQDDSAPDTSHLNGENEKSNCSECEIFDKEEIDHFQEDTDTTEQLKQLMESVTAKVKARQTAGQVGDPVSICSKPEECESTECECTKPLLTESDKQQKKYESGIYNVEV